MRSLNNRKGAFVVLFGLLFIVLMGAAAMSIDMSRIWEMRNELQTAADGGALAGAIQLTPPHESAYTADTATVFARKNRVLNDMVVVDSVQIGVWDDDEGTFANGGTPANAVHVVVSHRTNGLIMSAFGVAAPTVKARATAWANAPVNQATCVKPWTVPMVVLMSRLNSARGITPPNSATNLSRPFDQILDVAALNSMTPAHRTFQLKLGSGGIDDAAPGGSMPGSFQAVQLPRRWGAESQSYNPDGPPGNGADAYRANIAGPECVSLAIGDSLKTESGNMVGPTIQGVTADPGVCETLVGEDTNAPSSDPAFGDCLDANGNNGVKVKAGFYMCSVKCNGSTTVAVKMLGSFTLKKIYPDKSKNKQTPAFDKAEIVGEFDPITATGPVGPGPTTLNRLILVK